MRRLAVLLFAAVLMSSAYAVPSAVLDMDASGGARMTITDSVDLDASEVMLTGAADGSDILVLTGSLTDASYADDPDYSMDLTASGSTASITFTLQAGADNPLSQLGDFEATATMSVAGGQLDLDISATMSKEAIENVLLLDVAVLESDPQGFKADLESALNEAFAAMSLLQTPQVSITEFSISGSSTVQIRLKVSVSGWAEFMAAISALSSPTSSTQGDLMACLGINQNDLALSMLNAGSATTAVISSSGGVVTGRIDTSAQQGGPLGIVALSALNAEMSKSGMTTSIDVSASVLETPELLKCLMHGYLPGDYNVQSLDYALAKSSGGAAMQSLEGQLTGVAVKSGGNMEVSFPAEAVDSMNITINPPSGMDILSVSGGQKSGNSAVSTGGEFRVVYGKGGGIDMTLIAAIVAVVLVLLLLLSRRKKK